MSDSAFRRTMIPLFSGVVAVMLVAAGCQTIDRARSAQSEDDRLDGEVTISPQSVGITNGCTATIDQLSDIALRYHPSILQASQSVAMAHSRIQSTRAGYLPQVSVNGGYTRSTHNGRRNESEMSGNWSGGISLDLLLYDFGKLDAQEKQAIENLIAAEKQLRQSQVDVLYNVRSKFFEVHRTSHLLIVAQENLNQYKVHLDEAKSMLKVGTRRKYDVTKAEVDYGNAQLQVISASNNLISAKAELNAALGFADSPQYNLQESQLPKRQIDDAPDALMEFARKNSPSLAVLRARERAASAYVDETIASFYPSITAGVSADVSGKSFPLAFNWSWFGRAMEDIFTGFRRTAQVDIAVAELRSARAAVAQAEQTLYLELVQAVAQRDSARERSAVSRKTFEQATENFDIVNEQYRVGTSSSIERTDAQVQVTQARADMVRSFYDEQIAQAKIASLIGLLLEPR